MESTEILISNKGWYAYDGIGNPFAANSYRLAEVKPRCDNGNYICSIYAGLGFTTPNAPLSANILQYIADALVTLRPQPSIKAFVYLKDLT